MSEIRRKFDAELREGVVGGAPGKQPDPQVARDPGINEVRQLDGQGPAQREGTDGPSWDDFSG
jgi:hypothetical protein